MFTRTVILSLETSFLTVFDTFLTDRQTDRLTDRPTNRPTDRGCVSTQRHKRDSNVGFANRDFTSLFLKTRPTPISRVRDLQTKNDLE